MKKIPRRTAVTAALATVGGMVMPLLGAGAAQAATAPTQISVVPTNAYTTTGNAVDYAVTLDQAAIAPDSVYFNIASGPGANATSPFAGTSCSGSGTAYVCTVPAAAPGVASIHFYYGGTAYNSNELHTDGTLTIAGPVQTVSVTPTASHVAQGNYVGYTVSAVDSSGRPVAGATVNLSVAQANATTANLTLATTDPNNAFTGTAAPTANGNGTVTGSVTTADGTNNTTAGTAKFWVASQVVGSAGITAYVGGSGPATPQAVQTIDPGTANDVTSVALSPASQNAYEGAPVTVTATLTNAQGDPVGGVTPVGQIVSGPDSSATVLSGTTTNGLGQSTFTYTAGNTAGTDTGTVWVDQTDHAVNNTGVLDPGEPHASATAAIAPYTLASDYIVDSAPYNPNCSCDMQPVPAGTPTGSVTYTVYDKNDQPVPGVTVYFTLPNGKTTDVVGASTYSVSPDHAVTDAKGQVSVSVSDSAAKNGDSIDVTASLPTNPTGTTPSDTVTFSWQTPSAALGSIVITPHSASSPVGGSSATFTVSATDQFGNPVTGLTYQWAVTGRNNVNNNQGATGTGATFSYTDKGAAGTPGYDTVTVTASNASGQVGNPATATQYWYVGSGQTKNANIDLTSWNVKSDGYYEDVTTSEACQPSSTAETCTPVNFTTTRSTYSGDVVRVSVGLVDANGDALQGRQVTLTTSGVGQFVDANGNPLGSSTTATVQDGTGYSWPMAVAYVSSNAAGTQQISAVTADGASANATVTYSNAQYTPVTPQRVVDTRINQGDVWGPSMPNGRLMPNTLYYFDVGNSGIPSNAGAYAFNVTAIHPSGAGNLRIAPANCSSGTVPPTSLINYQPGKDIANFAVIPSEDCGGEFTVYSDGASVALAVDVEGYYGQYNQNYNYYAGVQPIAPYRVVDTRNVGGPVAANTSRAFQIGGTGGSAGVPATATAVALNITAVGPTGVGNLRVYPDGSSTPNSSSINYIKGVDKAAFVIAKLPADGKIDVYSDGSATNVVIDAYAYYDATDTATVTQAPVRILDTRTGTGSTLSADTPFSFPVAGHGNVPADAQAVLATVTAIHTTDSTGYGNLRVYPAGVATPTVSTINYVSKTSDVANFVIVPIGPNGKVTLYSDGSRIDVAFDVVGWIPAGASMPPLG